MPHLYAFVLSSFSFLIYLTWKGTVNSGSSQLNHGSFACMVLAKEVELLKSGKCGKSPILWWLRLAHSIGINGKRSHVPRELLSGELWEAATLNPTRSRPTLTYTHASWGCAAQRAHRHLKEKLPEAGSGCLWQEFGDHYWHLKISSAITGLMAAHPPWWYRAWRRSA